MPSLETFRPEKGRVVSRTDVPSRYKWDLSAICASAEENARSACTSAGNTISFNSGDVEPFPVEGSSTVPAARRMSSAVMLLRSRASS